MSTSSLKLIAECPFGVHPDLSRDDARLLLDARRLAQSACGRFMAVIRHDGTSVRCIHSGVELWHQMVPHLEAPSIKDIDHLGLTIWGHASNGKVCVWRIQKDHRRLMYEIDEIVEVHDSPRGRVLVASDSRHPHVLHVLHPDGPYRVQRGIVQILPDASALLTCQNGSAWSHFSVVDGECVREGNPMFADAKRVIPVRWNGEYAYFLIRSEYSVFSTEERDTILHGEVEHIWYSATEHAVAYVVCTKQTYPEGPLRRLYINHDIVSEGPFSMTSLDFVWASDAQLYLANLRFPLYTVLISDSGEIARIERPRRVWDMCIGQTGKIAYIVETHNADGECVNELMVDHELMAVESLIFGLTVDTYCVSAKYFNHGAVYSITLPTLRILQ